MVELFESKALLQVADTEADEHLEGVLENAASTHDASRAAPSSYSDWEIDSEQLKLDRELGRGGKFGRCFGGEWRGTPCTVKVIHDTKSPKPRAVFVREVENMARLHHPHIVQFLGFCAISGDAGTQLWLVMEHFSRGSLHDFISRDSKTRAKRVSFATKRRLCVEMGLALTYLHNRRPSFLIHRDIKPSNFLLTSSMRVKLGDFGTSRLFDESKSSNNNNDAGALDHSTCGVTDPNSETNCGTVPWTAPEVWRSSLEQKAQYSIACDVFSLGMVYYFVFERAVPQIAGCDNTPQEYLAALRAGRRPPFARTPPRVAELVGACWATDEAARPKAGELAGLLQQIPGGGCFG